MITNKQTDQEKIWAYMVMEGRVTTGEFSYYGGHFEGPSDFDNEERDRLRKIIIDKIGKFGVAWDATGVPIYMAHNEFVGTDHPSQQCECLLGTLVLCDGTKYTLGVKDASDEYINLVEAYTLGQSSSPDYVSVVFGKK